VVVEMVEVAEVAMVVKLAKHFAAVAR